MLFLAPPIIKRRRRSRLPISPKLAAAGGRVAELAQRAGLRHPPTVMLGTGKQLDAFSYGSPRRHRIALPRAVAVRWSNRTLFDPLVAHELAHLCNRDVGLSWLTRGVMYAVVPTLALPLVVGAATAEFSLFTDYAWRAAILAVTVWMISIALLRSREHDADLRAAILMGDPTAMAALFARLRPPPQVWWRRLKAHHPTPAARAEVLARPQCAAVVKFLDGLAPAFLAASAIPLVEAVVTALSTANPFGPYQSLVATGMGGVLLGGTVGIGISRAVAVDRAVSARPSPWVPSSRRRRRTGARSGGVTREHHHGATRRARPTRVADRPGTGRTCRHRTRVQPGGGVGRHRIATAVTAMGVDARRGCRESRLLRRAVPVLPTSAGAGRGELGVHPTDTRRRTRQLASELGSGRSCCYDYRRCRFRAARNTGAAWLFALRPIRPPWLTVSGTAARPLLVGVVCGVCAPRPLRAVSNRHAESPGRDRGNRTARGDDVERRHRRGGGGPCLDGVPSRWPRALNSRRTGCRVHVHDRVRRDQCRRWRAEEHQARCGNHDGHPRPLVPAGSGDRSHWP